MNTLSKLPIRVKIFSASIAGILGFMLYFLFVLFSGIDAQSRLSSVRDATFPALELAKNNIVLQERIEELLTTAINTGELEPIEQAQSFFDTLSANTQNLLSLQAQYASSVSDIQNKLDTYHNSAFPLSRQMVEGTVDFSSISKLAADKSSATSALNEALRAYNETTLNAFNKDIKDVDSSLSRTFQVGILIGIGTLIMMLSVSWLISNSISGTVHTITRSLKEIAEGNGDLTKRIPKSSQDELGELVHWFNLFIDKLQNTIREVVDVVNNLSSVSSELNDVTVLTTRVSQKQTTASNHLSATMEDMYGAINNVTSNASSAAEAAADADIEAQNGQKVVNETMTSINELAKEVEYAAEVIGKLEKDTENVGSILSVIQSIAEQTNLLALNAAIEAARAGEQGRGFAVVADEVRTLASRTQDATHEIQTMIEQLQSAAASATDVMNNSTQKASNSVSHADETGKSLREITDKVKVIKNMNGEIAGSTESQQRQAESITQNIKEMSQSAEEACNSTALVSKLSESLQNLANQLSANTSQFKA